MIAELAIKIENLSKHYPLKEVGKNWSEQKSALKSLSVEIFKGETIALIGSNGSGKSTLLSILSGITKPSSGKAILNGTVASILQIGDNFHPDLTGRENMQLYFKLNQVDAKEIKVLEDKVKEFSGLEAYYDEPVKHYSQGMFLRLAFSTAFHKNADIYLLDEVMGVGDDAFKLKSEMVLKKLKEEGKTIIMATHDKQEVIAMSNRCLWLEQGALVKIDKPQNTIVEYSKFQRLRFEEGLTEKLKTEQEIISPLEGESIIKLQFQPEQYGNENLWINTIDIFSTQEAKIFKEDTIFIQINVHKKIKGTALSCQLKVRDAFNNPVFFTLSIYNAQQQKLEVGTEDFIGNLKYLCEIPSHTLAGGEYYLSLFFGKKDKAQNISVFSERAYKFPNEIKFVVDSKGDEYISEPVHYALNPAWKWSLER